MSWPMPTPGQWHPGIQMTPDMNVAGTYTPEQWAVMQQQNWQQWAQWQQQYAQWQTQYGDKYAQQMQSFQSMVPPVPPPTSAPPPVPPPPENKPPPPPPPHENDQPLYGNKQIQSTPTAVPPPNQAYNSAIQPPNNNQLYNNALQSQNTNQAYNNAIPTTVNNQTTSYTTSRKPEQPVQTINVEALQKLEEEEKMFDVQFQKWEEEIEKWRQENVNHPDKQAYKEYEQKFETCRVQLLERRQQMKQKRARLMGNASQVANTKSTGNISSNVPLQNNNMNNYNQNVHQNNQNLKNIPAHNTFDKQNVAQYHQTNILPLQVYNRNNNMTVNTQERMESVNKELSSQPTNTNFLPSSQMKNIPGLDLVPEVDRSTTQVENVIDITGDNTVINQSQPLFNAPDYSTISKGINNILGDEKIMNILSMVTNPPPSGGRDTVTNMSVQYAQNQWDGNNYQNKDFGNQQQKSYKQQNVHNYTNMQESNTSYQDYHNNYQEQYTGHKWSLPPNSGHPPISGPPPTSGPPPISGPQPIRDNSNVSRPIIPNMPPHSQGVSERMGLQNNMNLRIPPPKPKWVEEPLFTPSIIVNYEHKPLRLKARGFIEPVHMFDYNHKSKDGGNNTRKNFESEIDDLFTRIPKKGDTNEWHDPYKDYSKDYERRSIRDEHRESRSKPFSKDDQEIFNRRTNDFSHERRRDDRERFGEEYDRKDKLNDHVRDLGRERDYGRGRDLGRDRDLARDRDYGRDRDSNREKEMRDRDLGRERDFPRDRESARDRDNARDRDRIPRDREYGRDKDVRARDTRRDDSRNRSRSRDRDSRKREYSKDNDSIDSSGSKRQKESKEDPKKAQTDSPQHIVMIDDLLEPPGRDMRPSKIVIILRGPPGSGKSYLAKLIRDKEAEYGGTVRIMSIDDYFMQESEIEETDPITGKIVKKPLLKYEYDESYEETYNNSLKRAFKRSLTDGYFSFLIYDAVNEHLRNYADMWNFARQCGFQVYICTMELDPQICFKRNIHNRSLKDIEVISTRFFPSPVHHIKLDATTLLQSASITDVQMEDAEDVTMEETSNTEVESSFTSKWEKMDDAAQLARLDGTNKPLRPSQLSMEDYLQLDDWKPNTAKPGKKTVRWADIEESRQQEKMRAIGFVVGQTDWNRMTDPTMGSSALTQTKYIERVRRS